MIREKTPPFAAAPKPIAHSRSSPPLPMVMAHLRRSILPGLVTPPQTIAIDKDHVTHNPTVIDP